jgi:D-psicose/D-tagatose/L-ribulose 3-epimerase
MLAPRVAEFGYDAIELPLENLGDWHPEIAAKVLRQCGLDCAVGAVMAPGRELAAAEAATVELTQQYLRACIDAAAVVGARVVSGPLYSSVGRVWRLRADERSNVINDLRENLRPLADHAAAKEVRLGIGPLNRYETSLINTTEQAMELLEGLPPEGIGLALDVYHMNIEERRLGDAVRMGAERLIHLQVAGNDRGTPGRDHIEWDELGEALRQVHYCGMVSIESFTPDNVTIARAASIWRPLAETQDAIAIEGLSFLRRWVQRWRPTER